MKTKVVKLLYFAFVGQLFFSINAKAQLPKETAKCPCEPGFTIGGVYMSDEEEDRDNDGFNRWRNLYFDANAESGSHLVYAQVFYKPSDSENYQLYTKTDDFTINRCEWDYRYVHIGPPVMELAHNIYDFKIVLYDAKSNTPLAEKLPPDDHDLNDQWFENIRQDEATFAITSLNWGNEIDYDEDGYSQSRKLTVDVDVEKNNYEVYLAYSIEKGDVVFGQYFSEKFYVTDTAKSDTVTLTIGAPDFELPHGIYNITLNVVLAENNTIVASTFETGLKFEAVLEDAIPDYNLTIADYNWKNTIDMDKDGYSRSAYLEFSPVVNAGTHTVYSKIYLKQGDISTFTLYSQSNPFIVSDTAHGEQTVFIGNNPLILLAHNHYDFKIEVYDVNLNKLLFTSDYTLSPPLAHQPFEINEEDGGNKPMLDQFSWTESVDKDNDLFYSKRKLNFNFVIAEGHQQVYAQLSACAVGSVNEPCWYASSEVFEINASNTQGFANIVIGGDSGELAHNGYKISLQLFDPITHLPVSDYYTVDQVSNFESKAEEVNIDDLVIKLDGYRWISNIDYDSDGKCSSRRLVFYVSSNLPDAIVYADVFVYPNNTAESYFTTNLIQVAISPNRTQFIVLIGSRNGELSGDYNLKIVIHEGISNAIKAEHDGNIPGSILHQVKFETLEEDFIVDNGFDITDIQFTNRNNDRDGDGFCRNKDLSFTIKVKQPVEAINCIILYKPTGLLDDYRLYKTIGTIQLNPEDTLIPQTITIGSPNRELDHAGYDFRIIVTVPKSGEIVIDKNAGNEPELSGHNMETKVEDRQTGGIFKQPQEFVVAPNPVIDEVIITGEIPENSDFKIFLFSSTGEPLEISSDFPKSGIISQSVSLSHLQRGTYILKIIVGDQVLSYKLQKM